MANPAGPATNINGIEARFQTCTRDTSYAPVQVASGVDAKVFRLASVPIGVQGVNLYGGNQELNAAVTVIGYGLGRDPADTTLGTGSPLTVAWGSGNAAKRWGVNQVSGLPVRQNGGGAGYDYDALETTLDDDNGANEAGLATGDSGSGMFAFLGGKWQLIGLDTAVSTSGSSVFGGTSPDTNLAVRISSYQGQIQALIPEPAGVGMFMLAGGLLLLRRPSRGRAARPAR